MYEEAYLSNDADRGRRITACLIMISPRSSALFIAGAEFDPLLDDSRLLYQTLAAHRQPL